MTRLRGCLSGIDPVNLNQVILAEGNQMKTNTDSINSRYNRSSTKVALSAVMAALIAVTTIIAIPLPPPLSTINLAPIVIFVASILLGPIAGVSATAIGCGIGYLAGTSLGTIAIPPGFLFIYLVGLIAARVPMAAFAGSFRKRSEIAGMTVGVVIETSVFFAIDLFLFGIAFAIFDLAVLVDLVFVPVTLMVLLGVRRMLSTKYLA
jgi:uncharacterized membrane protein